VLRDEGPPIPVAPGFRLLCAALFLGILLAYLLLPTRNYYWDGIGFAQTIEDAPHFDSSLIHPNHLLYTAAGYLEYRLAQAAGFHARALSVLQVANSVGSALCALVLFLLLVRYGCPAGCSALLTLLFAFSAAWWKYSTDANSYIPATLCLLLCFRLLYPGQSSRPWHGGALHAAGMLLHQLSLIFFPVIVVGLWRQNPQLPRRRRLLACLQYGLTASLITTAAYAAAYRWKQESSRLESFPHWITSHSPEVGFSFDTARDALLTLRGNLQLFFGGRVLPVLRQRDSATMGLLVLLAAILAGLVYETVRRRSAIRWSSDSIARRNEVTRAALLLPALWIAAYLLFLFFWLPWNTFYRLLYFPAVILLIGILLAPVSSKGRMGQAALLISTVAIFNLTFYILPNARVDSNPPLQMALRMSREWKPGTVVYYATFVTDDWTARYFNPSSSWRPLPASGLAALDAELQGLQASGKNVWLETTALDRITALPGGAEWISSHVIAGSRRELINAQHRILFQQIAATVSGSARDSAGLRLKGNQYGSHSQRSPHGTCYDCSNGSAVPTCREWALAAGLLATTGGTEWRL
jgi:hypothetical protein